jgi:hypothetical protein
VGTTVSSLHLFIGDDARAEQQRVIAVLEAVMQQHGFQTAPPERAERTLYAALEAGSPWVSITYGHLLERMPDTAAALSQPDSPIIEIDVYDSDVLQMQLSFAGQTLDTFSDWANYDNRPRQRSGDASLWAQVLPAVPSADALETAWTPQQADYPFESEGALYRVLKLLKIEPWRLWLGKHETERPDGAQVVTLHFRYAGEHPYDRPATGLPAFQLKSYASKKQYTIPMHADPDLVFSVMNLGGESAGIEITLQGDALDKGLVEPFRIIIKPLFNSGDESMVAKPEKQTDADGQMVYRFRLETHPIPAGIADWDAVYALPIHLRDFQREYTLQNRGGMFAVALKPLRKGAGELRTRIAPLANPDAAAAFITAVKVT